MDDAAATVGIDIRSASRFRHETNAWLNNSLFADCVHRQDLVGASEELQGSHSRVLRVQISFSGERVSTISLS